MAELSTRQRVRRSIQSVSFLLFPVTIFYLSPFLIIAGAFLGILAGSALVFAALFLSSLLLGRSFCGWICPAGGMQELLMPMRNRRVGPRAKYVKYAIWVPWLAAIVFGAVRAGGIRSVVPGLGTVGGLSVASVHGLIVYLIVVTIFASLSLAIGRRAACHTICWMAPFMLLGRSIRNVFRWPSLHLRAQPERCIECSLCTRECPMSIPVMERLSVGNMEHSECVLCGVCIDRCPKNVLSYGFLESHRHSTADLTSKHVSQ